jgi:hypothetical protein
MGSGRRVGVERESKRRTHASQGRTSCFCFDAARNASRSERTNRTASEPAAAASPRLDAQTQLLYQHQTEPTKRVKATRAALHPPAHIHMRELQNCSKVHLCDAPWQNAHICTL